jgi:hypothetical protein
MHLIIVNTALNAAFDYIFHFIYGLFNYSKFQCLTVFLGDLDNDTLHFSVSLQSIFSHLTSISRHLESTKWSLEAYYIIAVHPMNQLIEAYFDISYRFKELMTGVIKLI